MPAIYGMDNKDTEKIRLDLLRKEAWRIKNGRESMPLSSENLDKCICEEDVNFCAKLKDESHKEYLYAINKRDYVRKITNWWNFGIRYDLWFNVKRTERTHQLAQNIEKLILEINKIKNEK